MKIFVHMQPTVFYYCGVKFYFNSTKLRQNLEEINIIDWGNQDDRRSDSIVTCIIDAVLKQISENFKYWFDQIDIQIDLTHCIQNFHKLSTIIFHFIL